MTASANLQSRLAYALADYAASTELLQLLGIGGGDTTADFAALTASTSISLTGGADLKFTGATGTSEVHLTDNLADALSIKILAGADMMVFKTTDSAESLTILSAATQKLAFFGVTPVVQGTAYTQTYSTGDKTIANPTAATLTVTDGAGTNDGTIGAITDNASTIAAVQELANQINKLVADNLDLRQAITSIIDDLQAFGLVA